MLAIILNLSIWILGFILYGCLFWGLRGIESKKIHAAFVTSLTLSPLFALAYEVNGRLGLPAVQNMWLFGVIACLPTMAYLTEKLSERLP